MIYVSKNENKGGEGYSYVSAKYCEARFSRRVNKIGGGGDESGGMVRAWGGVKRGRGREMDDYRNVCAQFGEAWYSRSENIRI